MQDLLRGSRGRGRGAAGGVGSRSTRFRPQRASDPGHTKIIFKFYSVLWVDLRRDVDFKLRARAARPSRRERRGAARPTQLSHKIRYVRTRVFSFA